MLNQFQHETDLLQLDETLRRVVPTARRDEHTMGMVVNHLLAQHSVGLHDQRGVLRCIIHPTKSGKLIVEQTA